MVIDTETSPKRGYLPILNITMGILVWVAKSFSGHTSVPAVFELQSGNGWHLLDLPRQEWLIEQGFHAGTDLSHDVQRSAEHKLDVVFNCTSSGSNVSKSSGAMVPGAKFQSEHWTPWFTNTIKYIFATMKRACVYHSFHEWQCC